MNLSSSASSLTLVGVLLCSACAPSEQAGTPAEVDSDEPGPEESPDLIVITMDTLRADHLGAYGYVRPTSPNFDALARESLLFDNCFAPMATTLPTHTSLFTGTWPQEHGVLANVRHGGERFVPSADLTTLARFLRRRGYETGAFVSAMPLKSKFGLAVGFGTYNMPKDTQRTADVTTNQALAWLTKRRSKPIFLWVHYFDPHFPYEAPDSVPRFESDGALAEYMEARRFAPEAKRPTGQVNLAAEGLNEYDREIVFMDSQLGRLLDALRERGRWQDYTIVVALADHGEGLNQHAEPGHGLTWNEQLHVPLLMRVPGQEPRRVSRLMSVVDVVPTLFGFASWRREETLLRQVSGQDVLAADYETRPVFGQTSPRQDAYGTRGSVALRTERWKYIRFEDGGEQLFDLESDPYELEDIATEQPDVCATLRTQLDASVARQKQRASELRPGGTEDLEPAELDALKSLGYGGDE